MLIRIACLPLIEMPTGPIVWLRKVVLGLAGAFGTTITE
jgi:hypothetical protein